MGYKKLLAIILIIIIVMFSLMLATSYAWYSFKEATTTFETVTANDNVIISYRNGEYISTNIAIPISSHEVDKYSNKNNFMIDVINANEDDSMLVTISLVDIVIDKELQNDSFRVELYHQGNNVASLGGDMIVTNEDGTKVLGTVTLDNDIDNNFELRVYILDNGTDQSLMMNQTFQAKILIDVVSKKDIVKNEFLNPDISIDTIMVDGVVSNSLPIDGYYEMKSTCTRGSKISWDPYRKVLIYNDDIKVNDNCSLTFTSSVSKKLLNEVEVGSYVEYVGTNGCDGKSCQGQNANYKSDTDMGYCYSSNSKFTVNGWRVGYIKDGSAYLISAGAPECACTNGDGAISNNRCDITDEVGLVEDHLSNLNKVALKYCNKDFAYQGLCDDSTSWAMGSLDFENIMGKALSGDSCYNQFSSRTCGYMNDLIDNGEYYWYATSREGTTNEVFSWYPSERRIFSSSFNYVRGVRPVLKLDSKVLVVSGSGTSNDPYIIKSGN